MADQKLTLEQVADAADQIYQHHMHAAFYDRQFDGGEFSEPCHSEMADRKVKDLAEANGFTYDQVLDVLNDRANQEAYDWFDLVKGVNWFNSDDKLEPHDIPW